MRTVQKKIFPDRSLRSLCLSFGFVTLRNYSCQHVGGDFQHVANIICQCLLPFQFPPHYLKRFAQEADFPAALSALHVNHNLFD